MGLEGTDFLARQHTVGDQPKLEILLLDDLNVVFDEMPS